MKKDSLYWNMDVEPWLNTETMVNYQFNSLKKMLIMLENKAPYFSRVIKENKLNPENLSGFEEFKEKIPLFDKLSFSKLVENSNGDYLKALDQIMLVNSDELDWLTITTGTTGVPTPYPFTKHDVDNFWGEVLTRGAWRAGIRSHDRILYCFALSMVIAGIPTMMGIKNIGALILPVGAEAKSERILFTQKLFKGTVYMGTPSLAEYLIEQAPKVLNKDVGEFGFKALLCGGEPGAGIPSVKAKLENAYKCKVYDIGAGFGFSCDHDEYQGMHSIADDLCYYELVDPVTKAPIPLEQGAMGEALFTTLNTEGWIMLRQTMGDIHQVFTDPCPCGRTGFRYKVIGRTDDMLKVKGVMIYPSNIKQIVNEFVPNVTGEMRIVLTEKPPQVVPPLKLRLEYSDDLSAEKLKSLEGEILEAMSRRLRVRPVIHWVKSGTLDRSHYKGKIFETMYD
jgi:phenylacetate-CoA ligase